MVVASTRLSANAKALVFTARRRSLQQAPIVAANAKSSSAQLQGAPIDLSKTDIAPV